MNSVYPKDSPSVDKLFTFFLGEVRNHEEIWLIRNIKRI